MGRHPLGWARRLHLLVLASCLVGGLRSAAPADEPEAKKPPPLVGDSLPAVEAVSDQGRVWKSSEHAGKGVLVIYFYPGDFTGGCIRQAQKFQELVDKFQEAGAEVVGISGDEAATHRLFKENYKLPQTLLADPEGKLATALGVPVTAGTKIRTRGPDGKPLMDERGKSIIVIRPSTLARWTFVVGSNGKILSRRQDVDPVKDAEEVLKLVKEGK
jgi:peroxiredoxin Q/BCP